MENSEIPANPYSSPTNQTKLIADNASINKLKYLIKSQEQDNQQQTMSFRKRKPTPMKIAEYDEQTKIYSKIPKIKESVSQQIIWRKKGKVKTDKITKINQINSNKQLVNIEGQVIFIWAKNQLIDWIKLAQKSNIAAQIYDGTGSVIFHMPIRYLYQRQLLQNGQNLRIMNATIKQNAKQKPYLICTGETVIEKAQMNYSFEPQKFAITVKQLLQQPVGTVRNVMGLIIQDRGQIEIIKKSNGTQLYLSKVIVYDPQQNCRVEVKLWGQKTKIKFYNSIYLLRGIQITEYKGKRQYAATKDFTYRALAYSKIENYLRPIFEDRQQLLLNKPIKATYRSIQKAYTILKENPQMKIVWSITECNIKQLVIDSYETFKYSLCSVFDNKVMISADKSAKCFFCLKSQNDQIHENHYALKMEFQDAYTSFYAQCHDQAVLKLFSQSQTETIQLNQFEQMTLEFKQSLSQRIEGDLIHGLFATIRQSYGNQDIVSNFLTDLVPIPEE